MAVPCRVINGCEVEVAFEGDVAAALGSIAAELEKLGYTPKSHEANELTMSFDGKWITSDPNKVRHSVTVAPAAGQLCFKFGTGWIASTWSKSEIEWAQARADQVVASARSSL